MGELPWMVCWVCQSAGCVSKLRSFPIGRNERSLSDETYESHHDFLRRMDAGEFDGTLSTEMKKLSSQQLEEVAKALAARDVAKRDGSQNI